MNEVKWLRIIMNQQKKIDRETQKHKNTLQGITALATNILNMFLSKPRILKIFCSLFYDDFKKRCFLRALYYMENVWNLITKVKHAIFSSQSFFQHNL